MKQMTVGELAKQANVTVRTIQYYDKIGLLKPSSISEGGRRLYHANDITILHQIITLKNLGLTLDEVKSRLMPSESTEDIKRMLLKQAELIKEQILKASKVIESIEMITADIETSQTVDWSKYSNMMQLIQENNESYWVMNFLDQDVLAKIVKVHGQYSEEELPSDWLVKSMKKAKQLFDAGFMPDSEPAQSLAAEVWAIVEKYAQGHPEMTEKLYMFFNDTKQWPDQYAKMQMETHAFLEASIEHYVKSKAHKNETVGLAY